MNIQKDFCWKNAYVYVLISLLINQLVSVIMRPPTCLFKWFWSSRPFMIDDS